MKKILLTTIGLAGVTLAGGYSQSVWQPASGSNVSWGTAGNWLPAAVPDAVGAEVIFNSPTANHSVSLLGGRTVGSIQINNDTAFTFTLNNGTGGALTMDVSTGNATITADGTGTAVNTLSASITLNDNLVVTVNNTAPTSASGALTMTGTIGGAGGLTKDGDGRVSLTTAAKTYTGATVVNGGILRVSEVSAPSATSSITVNNGGQFRTDSNNNRTWNLGNGNITLNGLGATGSTGALRQQGTMTASDMQFLTNNVILDTTSGIHIDGSNGKLTMNGTLSGNGGLVKTGAGALTLTQASTYLGDTTISNGRINLVGGATISSVGSLILDGGTLDVSGATASTYTIGNLQSVIGEGTINATGKTFAIAGILSPGSSPGSITINGDFTLASTAVSNFEIEGTTAGLFDNIAGVSTITFGGVLNLITGYAATVGDTVQLFAADTYSGGFDTITGTDLGGGLSWSFDASNGSITVIPEPGTWVLVTIGLSVVLMRRKLGAITA